MTGLTPAFTRCRGRHRTCTLQQGHQAQIPSPERSNHRKEKLMCSFCCPTRSGEIALQNGAGLAHLPEGLYWVPSTHMVAHNLGNCSSRKSTTPSPTRFHITSLATLVYNCFPTSRLVLPSTSNCHSLDFICPVALLSNS